MPSIQQLKITTFRNIAQAALELAPRLNLIAGENGSGKSSVLEAIYFLGLGRSFRNTLQTPVIQHGERRCSVYAELENATTLGISRSLDDPPRVRIQGEKAQNSAELASHLPLQLLNAEAFKLLEGGPTTRRQFIDWGVFHVEHQFHAHWRDFRRSLQNRNALLKRKAPEAELAPWSQEFVRQAREIDGLRKNYLEGFLPFLQSMLGALVSLDELSLRYYRGWSSEIDIADILEKNRARDLALGYTSAGPQRADLKIRVGSQYACDILSRGQQKLLVSTLKLAQGAYLARESGMQCLYLVDDLTAELDRDNREKVCDLLHQLGGQVFITGTEEEELLRLLDCSGFEAAESKLFHVKHGRISALDQALKEDPD